MEENKITQTTNDGLVSKLLDYLFAKTDAKAKDEEEEKKQEFITKEEFDKKIDEIKELLTKKEEEEKVDEEKKEDKCGSKDEEVVEEEKEKVVKADTLQDVLDAMNPLIASVSDENLKKEMKDSLAKFMDRGSNPISKTEQTIKDNVGVKMDESKMLEEIQKAYDKRNPHIVQE